MKIKVIGKWQFSERRQTLVLSGRSGKKISLGEVILVFISIGALAAVFLSYSRFWKTLLP